jgi:hypothetical protein
MIIRSDNKKVIDSNLHYLLKRILEYRLAKVKTKANAVVIIILSK